MKKTLLGSLILLAFAVNVQAQPNAETKGTVTFFGKVVENTCKVKTDNRNMSVVLNDVGKAHLTTKDNTAMPTPFTITLENCNTTTAAGKPKADKVGVYFYSWKNADKENSYTLKNIHPNDADKANNVNIQLMKDNGTDAIAVVGKETEDFVHKGNADNQTAIARDKNHISGATELNNQASIALHYIAQYYATGTATAGKVKSSVDFQIAYE